MSKGLYKILVGLFLVSCILLPANLLAIDSGDNVLTVSQAIELAQKYSPEIEKQNVANELARVNERDAWITYEQARGAYQSNIGSKTAMENAKKAYDAAVYANSDGKVSKENLNLKIAYDMETLYLNIISADNNIKLAEANYKLQTMAVRIEKVKLSLGLSTQYLVDQQIQKSMDLSRQLQSLYDSRKALGWQLNKTIGRDLDAPFELVSVTFQEVSYDPQQESLDKAKEASLAIDQYNRTIEDKQKETEGKRATASDKVEKLELEIKQTSLLRADSEYGIKLSLKNSYDKLGIAQQKLSDYRSNYDTAKQNYDNQKIQYELGLISKIAFDTNEIALTQAQINYERAVYDYYLAAREVSLAEKGISVSSTSSASSTTSR